MQLAQWDREAMQLASELGELIKTRPNRNLPSAVPLKELRVELAKQQSDFIRILDQIDSIVREKTPSVPRTHTESSFVHWTGIFSNRLRQYWTRQSRLLSAMMWAKLIKMRLAGPQKREHDWQISDEEIVGLAIKRAELASTEKQLVQHLETLKGKKDELQLRYKALLVSESNALAGNSLQGRLGRNVFDALRSPLVRGLENFLTFAFMPSGLERRGDVPTSGPMDLAGLCKKIIVANPKTAHSSGKSKDIKRLRKRLARSSRTLSRGVLAVALVSGLTGFGVRALAYDFCATGLKNSRLQELMWSQKVYDAMVEVQLVRSAVAGQELDVQRLEKRAATLARQLEYYGAASGVCGADSGWIAAFPAGSSLKRSGSTFELPVDELKRHCSKARVDFAGAGGGPSVALAVEDGQIRTESLGDGTISVTCFPNDRKVGPIMWFMAPVKKGPMKFVPFGHQHLKEWINSVRRFHGIKAVSFDNEVVNQAVRLLSSGESVKHDRPLLKKVTGLLDKKGVRLIGENRARGITEEDVEWLFWNSPRHRDLILDETAQFAGVADAQRGSQQLVVLITASDLF